MKFASSSALIIIKFSTFLFGGLVVPISLTLTLGLSVEAGRQALPTFHISPLSLPFFLPSSLLGGETERGRRILTNSLPSLRREGLTTDNQVCCRHRFPIKISLRLLENEKAFLFSSSKLISLPSLREEEHPPKVLLQFLIFFFFSRGNSEMWNGGRKKN